MKFNTRAVLSAANDARHQRTFHNPLELTPAEIDAWSPKTQAISKLADAHFNVFNEMCKGEKRKHHKALRIIWNAAAHIRKNFVF